MKIGILTFANVPNFGAALQALSTVGWLKQHGHEPVIIRWEPDDFRARFKNMQNQIQPAEHFHFFNEMFPVTTLCSTDKEVAEVIESEKIEAVIIGSDAVLQAFTWITLTDFPTKTLFRLREATSERRYPNCFWGSFKKYLHHPIPIALMSPSAQNVGFKSLSPRVKLRMKRDLQDMVYVSARDNWTRQMINHVSFGKVKALLTPDPVFAFNHNCEALIPSREEIISKYGLPDKYMLVSFRSVLLDNIEWMDGLKREAEKYGLSCVALPMPEGVLFKHNFDYEIPIPLSPLDWFGLIKYASGYVGENMHPVLVALHNAVPLFCFDNYGIPKFGAIFLDEKSSKIYDILSRFDLLANRVGSNRRWWSRPTPEEVMKKIVNFDCRKCQNLSKERHTEYEKMMHNIIDRFDKQPGNIVKI